MKKYLIHVIIALPLIAACSTLVVKNVNYGWPLENVLTTNESGVVEEKRHSITFNAESILKLEFGETVDVASKEIRIIRNTEGFYIITAAGFKNVYIFSPDESSLNLKSKFTVDDDGLKDPVLNQRNSYIELIDGSNIFEITSKGAYKRAL